MQMKHTEGPWDCWDMDETGWHVFASKFNEGGIRKQHCDRSIAQVRSGRSNADKVANYHEGVANAHLIAAAPEMLAVLKEIFTSLGDGGYLPSCGKPISDRARAVIAKASP